MIIKVFILMLAFNFRIQTRNAIHCIAVWSGGILFFALITEGFGLDVLLYVFLSSLMGAGYFGLLDYFESEAAWWALAVIGGGCLIVFG